MLQNFWKELHYSHIGEGKEELKIGIVECWNVGKLEDWNGERFEEWIEALAEIPLWRENVEVLAVIPLGGRRMEKW